MAVLLLASALATTATATVLGWVAVIRQTLHR